LPNHIFESINDFIFSEESKPLGSGSFGVVKKGVHKLTGKVYAIKIVVFKIT
jgi:serine/threonine protein kinase